MKIGFTTDTNFFGVYNQNSSKKATFLDEMDIFIDYVKDLENVDSKHSLEYCVPELVFEELCNQKKTSFKNSYNTFVEKYNNLSYGLIGELPKYNIDDLLIKEKNAYKKKVMTLTNDYNRDLFLEMIKDSLEKNPPFDKNKPNTGFKDALIWKTIVYSKDIDKYNEFYLFSGDKIFKENESTLKYEFSKQHPKVKLNIIFLKPNGNQRQTALNMIIDTHKLYKTEVIKLYNNKMVLPYIKKLEYCDSDISYHLGGGVLVNLDKILFENFNENDFLIDKVEKKDKEFDVSIVFRTTNYIEDRKINGEDKKYLIGNIKLKLKENKNNFEYVDSEIFGVDFDIGVIDLLRGFSINSASTLVSEIEKYIEENYRINFECLEPLRKMQEKIKNITQPVQNIQKACEMPNPLKEMQESIKSIAQPFENIQNLKESLAPLKELNQSEPIEKTEKISENLDDKDNKQE